MLKTLKNMFLGQCQHRNNPLPLFTCIHDETNTYVHCTYIPVKNVQILILTLNFLRAFDEDNNGYIDFKEFLLSIHLTSFSATVEDKLKWTFKLFDVDGNGLMDQNEMLKVIQALHKLLGNQKAVTNNAADELIKKIFAKIDTNHG